MRLSLPVLLLCACHDDGEGSEDDGTTPDSPDGDVVGDDDDDDDTDTGTLPSPPIECTSTFTVLSATATEGVQPMEQHLAVTLDGADGAWVSCTSPDDPDELHLVENLAASESHDLVLRGLLANTAYTCEAHATCGEASVPFGFQTGIPEGVPQLSAQRNPAATMSGAYTLFNTQAGCGGNAVAWVMIADPEGKIRWTYPIGTDLVTDIDATLIDANTVHVGGGWGIFNTFQSNRGVFRTIDLSGNVLVERDEPDFGVGFNHHSGVLPDGTYLTLTGSTDHRGNHEWIGVGVEQWSPTAGVVWTWDSQALVESGFLDEPSPFEFFPPYHANSVDFVSDPGGEAMWISNFGTEQLWRVDRATGELTDVFGHDGDFVLLDAQGDELPDSEFPYIQHGPDYTSDGRVLLYDNGDGRPGGSYSRVAEYQLDLASDEATLLWSWTEPDWYQPIIGDADYLENGNVLVTQGFPACLPVGGSPDASALVELTPPDTVVWRLTWPNDQHSVYRSQRYDGCDVFGNARYCPAVADRIATLSAAR